MTPLVGETRQVGTSSRRLIGALLIGGTLEWYDFLLYGAMSALVFGPLFFPGSDAFAASLASFAVFAVGYVIRPIGGIVFGAIGDRYGRKPALVGTFILMGATSTAIGLLPTYLQLGIGAPFLLVLLRILQGAGAGSEFGMASVFAVESAAVGKKASFGAYPAMGVLLGQILSILVLRITTGVTGEAFGTWGWRIPFLASVLLVGVGLWMRSSMGETPEFAKIDVKPDRMPILDVFAGSWRSIVGVFFANAALAVHASFFVVFSLYYLTRVLDLPREFALQATLLGSIAGLVCIPVGGRIADHVGLKRYTIAALSVAALTSAMFFPLVNTRDVALVYTAVVLSYGSVGLILSPQGALFAEQFRTETRASGFMLGRETSTALFSGLTPIVATLLLQAGGALAVSLLVVGVCLVSAAATMSLRETRSVGQREGWDPVR